MRDNSRKIIFNLIYCLLGISVLIIPFGIYMDNSPVSWRHYNAHHSDWEDYPRMINLGIVGMVVASIAIVLFGKNRILDYLFILLLIIINIIACFFIPSIDFSAV